jgi:hypothetical protein
VRTTGSNLDDDMIRRAWQQHRAQAARMGLSDPDQFELALAAAATLRMEIFLARVRDVRDSHLAVLLEAGDPRALDQAAALDWAASTVDALAGPAWPAPADHHATPPRRGDIAEVTHRGIIVCPSDGSMTLRTPDNRAVDLTGSAPGLDIRVLLAAPR